MLKEILKSAFITKNAVAVGDGDAEIELVEKDGGQLRDAVAAVFGRSVRIRQVDGGSCNACEWECIALTNPVYDIQRFGVDFVASPRHADILLVTGPVSRQMELALRKTYIATPDPKFVIACGACARDGGVFQDSYAVTNGVAAVVPVDLYIDGCPPAPLDLIRGIRALMAKLQSRS